MKKRRIAIALSVVLGMGLVTPGNLVKAADLNTEIIDNIEVELATCSDVLSEEDVKSNGVSASDSGTIGEFLNWSFYANEKKLVITGMGTLPSKADLPWAKYEKDIEVVEIIEKDGTIKRPVGGIFDGNPYIKKVTLPDSFKSINFNSCTSLEEVNIPSSVDDLDYAFVNCTSLKKITIPDNVRYMSETFVGCTNLEEVVMPKTMNPSSMRKTFKDCTSLQSIIIPNGVEYMENTFENCTSLKNVTMPDSLIMIGSAFINCTSLESMTIPQNVWYASNAFKGCTSLKYVNFKDAINSSIFIENAFVGCTSLEEVELPEALINMRGAFVNCASLKKIHIPDETTLTHVTGAFVNCTGLKEVNIPAYESMVSNSVASNDFTNCKLDKIFVSNRIQTIDAYGFSDFDAKELVFDGSFEEFFSRAKEIYDSRKNDKNWFAGKAIINGTQPTLEKVDNSDNGIVISWKAMKYDLDKEMIQMANRDKAKADTEAITYRIYRKTAKSDWVEIGKTNTTTFTDSAVIKGETYYYSVSASGMFADVPYETNYNKDGLSIKCTSNVNELSTPVLKSATNTTTGVKVVWDHVEGAEKYRVYRKQAGGSWKTMGTAVSKDGVTGAFVDKTVVSGETYIYTVRCITEDGKNYASGYDKKGIQVTYVAAPTLSKIANATNGVKLAWNASAGASNYRVFRKTEGGKWQKVADTTKVTFEDTTAISGTIYTYTVRCLSEDGKSYTSAYDTTGLSIMYLSTPAVKVAKTTDGIKVSYGKVAGAKKYYVYRKTGTGLWVKITTTTTTSYIDKTAKAGIKYYYTVKAVSDSYTSAFKISDAIMR